MNTMKKFLTSILNFIFTIVKLYFAFLVFLVSVGSMFAEESQDIAGIFDSSAFFGFNRLFIFFYFGFYLYLCFKFLENDLKKK
jgi:hypothetical protein